MSLSWRLLRPARRRFAAGIGLALGAVLIGLAPHSASAMPGARVMLGGQTFAAELADTPALQGLGLGGRKRLGPNEGMLFLYAGRGRHTFWMKGMLIPIDMIWFDNSRVVHIEHRVPPPAPGTRLETLPTYTSELPANAVLEIAAGRAAEIGLRVGDYARFDFGSN